MSSICHTNNCSLDPPQWLSYISFVSSLIICLVATTTNALILVAVWRLKRLHTPFNYYLVNLVVSDLIVGVVSTPIATAIHYKEAVGVLGKQNFNTIHMSFFIAATASLLALILLTVDRYFAIVHSIKYRQLLDVRRCAWVSMCMWVFSLTVPFIYLKIGYICYLLFYATSGIVFGLLIIVFTYVKILTYLRRRSELLRASMEVDKEREIQSNSKQKKVTWTLLTILGAYLATYMTASVFVYLMTFCRDCNCTAIHVFRDMSFNFINCNSMVNPIICIARLKSVRKGILQVLKIKRKRSTSNVSSSREHTASTREHTAGTREQTNSV